MQQVFFIKNIIPISLLLLLYPYTGDQDFNWKNVYHFFLSWNDDDDDDE